LPDAQIKQSQWLRRELELLCNVAAISAINTATIAPEPKIRTAEQNLILLHKKETIFSVCTTNVRSHVCVFISRNDCLQQCIFLDFLLLIITENVFSLAYFLIQLNAKLSLQNQLS